MDRSGRAHSLAIELEGNKLRLLPEKALFLESEKVLLIADLHLGKINHFRMAGIPLPRSASQKNLDKLVELISKTKPAQVVFLGDLFHSSYNSEWEELGQVLRHFGAIDFHLIRGNHDIMSQLQYERHKISVSDKMKLGSFMLTHELDPEVSIGSYNLAGHVHPGVRLSGKGKQSMMLPCFYFGERSGLLPAFGTFTGLARVKVEPSSKIYLVAENKILEVNHD